MVKGCERVDSCERRNSLSTHRRCCFATDRHGRNTETIELSVHIDWRTDFFRVSSVAVRGEFFLVAASAAVTFSCYKRQRYLHTDFAKRIVIGQLGSRLAHHQRICLGFVIMPGHVPALIWFPKVRQLSAFMNK